MDVASFLDTLIDYGGVSIWIRDSSNPHYTLVESEEFAVVIYVSMSSAPYIDIFPPFKFHGGTSRLLWDESADANYAISF